MQCGCGWGCRPAPSRQLLPGAGQSDAGWLPGNASRPITPLHGCQATERRGFTWKTRAGVFLFPSCSKSLLRSCRRICFPSSKGPHHTLPSPQPSPQPPAQRFLARPATASVVHSRGPGPLRGGQQAASRCSSQRPGKGILSGAGNFRLRKDDTSKEGPESELGQALRSLASEQLWDGHGVGGGHGLGLDLALHPGYYLGVSQTFRLTPCQCLTHL